MVTVAHPRRSAFSFAFHPERLLFPQCQDDHATTNAVMLADLPIRADNTSGRRSRLTASSKKSECLGPPGARGEAGPRHPWTELMGGSGCPLHPRRQIDQIAPYEEIGLEANLTPRNPGIRAPELQDVGTPLNTAMFGRAPAQGRARASGALVDALPGAYERPALRKLFAAFPADWKVATASFAVMATVVSISDKLPPAAAASTAEAADFSSGNSPIASQS
jgi:hypothetical protein